MNIYQEQQREDTYPKMPKNLSLFLEALGLVWYCLLGLAASDFSEIIKMLTKALWFQVLHLGLSYNLIDFGVWYESILSHMDLQFSFPRCVFLVVL